MAMESGRRPQPALQRAFRRQAQESARESVNAWFDKAGLRGRRQACFSFAVIESMIGSHWINRALS